MKSSVILRFAHIPPVIHHECKMFRTCLYCGLVAERVVGWEGSNAVSPPRDDAAWALRNRFLRG